ncbi:hypothetical protein [Nostoc sp. 'Peltigera malacea cyanobiont' DB3992]|uniref:hypothetical protein n=1 Tax=Nostoc sp. 'Peltigera malacea cyanobiont' DB3992 TaxID=1206980 RepID=UPI000C054298|nr:hypothetical protein [Nostoc sp. 'Peltigera malacea cyanobiont' DB3992]PHM10358.1 hypothetical protein CK516_09010 [Nostoc sp. 'Peltigera malacea cyanobiont' DB3992]
MLTTESLTEAESQLAHNLAITLVKEETDVNEVGKVIAYLRSIVEQPDAGRRFFSYLKTLVTNGRQIGHSGRTPGYYRSIERACNQYLQSQQANAHTMLKILGWAMRLMRYYKVSPIEEISISESPQVKQVSERQAEITEVASHLKFDVNQILDATVTAKKGNKVTYEILEKIKLTQKESKKAEFISEGQIVRVEVVDIKEDGSIRKIRCID